jgi:Calcium/calmodulin dependent protein kinase II association domain
MTLAEQLVSLTQQLLESIANGDWATYERLCDPTLTAFEPEARGQLVEGLAFHKFFFDRRDNPRPSNTTICAPHVRLIGADCAIVSYVRLHQGVDSSGVAGTRRFEETRVWQLQEGQWRHVHFHRSTGS